jgi:hypothetical protein
MLCMTSRNFTTFCSNEARWNTDSSCQNIKNIFVLAWGIICLQTISQTSAETKTVECINVLQVKLSDVPMVGIITLCWLQCKWLPACHTIPQSHDPSQNSIPLKDRMTFKTHYFCGTKRIICFLYKMWNIDMMQTSTVPAVQRTSARWLYNLLLCLTKPFTYQIM